MRNKIVKILILSWLPVLCSAQKFDYGVQLKFNLATQTFNDPRKPEDGTTQWGYLKTVGAGFYGNYEVGSNFILGDRLNYIAKGFKNEAQTGIIGFPATFSDLYYQNKFHYVTNDFLLRYNLKKKNITYSFYGGLQLGYLFDYLIENDTYEFRESYPIKEYLSGFNQFSLGYILGIGTVINKILGIELEVNRDISKVLNKPAIQAKNWLWSANVNISIHELLKN